jgi:hypothetical protein
LIRFPNVLSGKEDKLEVKMIGYNSANVFMMVGTYYNNSVE